MLVAQSSLTLHNPIGSSPSGSSVYGTSQARILEWVAIPFSRGSSQPKDQIQVSCIAGKFFTIWATREPLIHNKIPICLQWRSWRKQHPILSVHITTVEHWGGKMIHIKTYISKKETQLEKYTNEINSICREANTCTECSWEWTCENIWPSSKTKTC